MGGLIRLKILFMFLYQGQSSSKIGRGVYQDHSKQKEYPALGRGEIESNRNKESFRRTSWLSRRIKIARPDLTSPDFVTQLAREFLQ